MKHAPTASGTRTPPAGGLRRRRNAWRDADVERHWDRVADIYVRENARVSETHSQRFEYAVPRLELFPDARILNVSSRDAGAEPYLHRATPNVQTIHAEISGGLIAVARRLHPTAAQVKLATYSQLPFDDASFDRALSLETLEHVAEPHAFLTELGRVVRPGGVLVLSCPPATAEFAYRVYSALLGGHGEGPHRFPSSRTVRRLLVETGWRLRAHEGTVLVPVGPRWLRRAGERLIQRFPTGLIGEWGIRQFYVADRP